MVDVNPFQSPETEAVGVLSGPREDVRTVAQNQKMGRNLFKMEATMMRSILPVAVILVFANASLAAIKSITELPDAPVVVTYDAGDGNVRVDTTEPANVIQIDSVDGIFGGSNPSSIFVALFGSSFMELDFGAVASTGLSEIFVLGDFTARGSFVRGGRFNSAVDNNVALSYIPDASPGFVRQPGDANEDRQFNTNDIVLYWFSVTLSLDVRLAS